MVVGSARDRENLGGADWRGHHMARKRQISRPASRFLTYLIGLLGAYAVGNQFSVVIAGRFLWEPLFFLFLVLTVVMDIGVAATFWRRTSLAGAGSQKPPSP
jgi:hypothetical protein